MTTPCVRPAGVNDAADMARVHVTSWRETYADLLPAEMLAALDVEARRQMWATALSDESASGLILALEDRVVGFGVCGHQRCPDLAAKGFEGEIGALYILSEARGLGGGRQLMTGLATALAARGKRGLSLWVLAGNTAARGFYERLGGRVSGERTERHPQGVLKEVAYGWADLNVLMR